MCKHPLAALLLALPLALVALPASAQSSSESTSLDAVAQDEEGSEEDDALKDILGDDSGTVKDEVDAVKSGEIGDNVGSRKEEIILLEEETRKKRLIKTLQRKTFLKLGRFEATPHVAFVTNDPFLNRYIVGGGFAYHVTEIFAVEASLDVSPDLGQSDWKPLTTQLVEENNVSPDISKLTLFGSLSFQYSPIYGKVAVAGRKIINFDIYGNFGMGATRTADDLEALQAVGDPKAIATQFQTHPTTNFGGGLRIIFGENLAARVETRSLVYIETVNATTLEMKNNLILQGAVSFFFPNMRNG
jgi:outer membrane beta-barrel protein